MQDISIPLAERTVPFNFPSGAEKLAPPMLVLEDAVLGYGEGADILRGVDLRLDPDDRIAIIGTNGQGKTTLVKSIAERLPIMAGTRKVPKAIRIGYFSQDQMDELTSGETVLDHVRRALPRAATIARQRAVSAAMGFAHEKVETKIEKLSGGEKVRLLLGLMAMEKPNILILDEPTSHLDIDSREALIYALNDFEGAVLLITHDVFLAEATADQLWLVKDGEAKPYSGDLADYRKLVLQADRSKADKPAKTKKVEVVEKTPAPKVDKAEQRRIASERRKAAAPLKRKADEAEKRLSQATKKLEAVDQDLAKQGQSSEQMQALMVQRGELTASIEQAELDWLEASEAYEAAISD
jgi:ATP-binding cassette subfamily F protein 3